MPNKIIAKHIFAVWIVKTIIILNNRASQKNVSSLETNDYIIIIIIIGDNVIKNIFFDYRIYNRNNLVKYKITKQM